MFQYPDDIVACFINYFTKLLSSSNPNLDVLSPLSKIIDSMADCPIVLDKEEVLQVLKGMIRNASPIPDGLSVAFYLLAWKRIGDDVPKLASRRLL